MRVEAVAGGASLSVHPSHHHRRKEGSRNFCSVTLSVSTNSAKHAATAAESRSSSGCGKAGLWFCMAKMMRLTGPSASRFFVRNGTFGLLATGGLEGNTHTLFHV